MLRDYLLIRFKKFAAGAHERKADPKVKGQHFPCGGYKLSVGRWGYCVRGVQSADANTARLEMGDARISNSLPLIKERRVIDSH